MGTVRRIQCSLCEKLMVMLQKSLCVLSRTDAAVISELKALPDSFAFLLDAGENAVMRLAVKEGCFVIPETEGFDADLAVAFKDITGAFPVLCARQSAFDAFSQHRMILRGSVENAVILLRVMNIARSYLVPGALFKKAVKRAPEKKGSALKFYMGLVFTKGEAFR